MTSYRLHYQMLYGSLELLLIGKHINHRSLINHYKCHFENAVIHCLSVFTVYTNHPGILLICRSCSVEKGQKQQLKVHVRYDGLAAIAKEE